MINYFSNNQSFSINMRQEYLDSLTLLPLLFPPLYCRRKEQEKLQQIIEEKREKERIERECEELNEQGYREIAKEKSIKQGSQIGQRLVFEPKRLKLKEYSPLVGRPKLYYLDKALRGDYSYDPENLKEGYSQKIYQFKNTYDGKQADYMSQMDRELLRLRNQISNEHQRLNNRLNLLKFQAQRTKMKKDEDLRDYDKEVRDLRAASLNRKSQNMHQNFRTNIVTRDRDSSYERMLFSKIGPSNTYDTPYKMKDESNNRSFAVVSSKLGLDSSFDPRTHNEQGMKGMYDYYKFGNQDKIDPFNREFDFFVDSNNTMIDEILTLNNSGSKFNNDQIVKTNTLHNKIRRLPEKIQYQTIREYNKNKVRFHNGISEMGPADILEDSVLSKREEAMAQSFLQDKEYVDINLTNKELL